MYFGALVFWAAISFTGRTSGVDVGVAPVGVAASDASSEPKDGVPEAPVRCESTFFPPALRVEAQTKVLRLVDLSAPRVARARWSATEREDCGATRRLARLLTGDRCRATDMRILARPVQAHSPPARR